MLPGYTVISWQLTINMLFTRQHMVYGVQTILQSRYWRTEVDNPSKNLTDGLFSHTVKHTANQRIYPSCQPKKL